MNIELNDLVLGVLYGTKSELSQHYKIINNEYPVLVGADFWHRVTGDEQFYFHLIDSIGEVANEANGKKLMADTIKQLSDQIEKDL